MDSLEKFDKYHAEYCELHKNWSDYKNKMFRDVCAHLSRDEFEWVWDEKLQKKQFVFTVKRYKGLAYDEFSNLPVMSEFFFPFSDLFSNYFHKSLDEFRGVLLDKWLESIRRERKRKAGGVSTYEQFFVKSFCDKYGYDYSDASVRYRLRRFFTLWGVNQLVGTAEEFVCGKRLAKLFGRDNVKRAERCDEKKDVDFIVCGVPVSCKTRGAFDNDTFAEYRYDYKKTTPVLYINECLSFVVPDDATKTFSEERGWRELPAFIEDYNKPDDDDDDFGSAVARFYGLGK